MPYGRFHHDNRSRHAVTDQTRDYAISPAQSAAYDAEEDGLSVVDRDEFAAQEGYELNDLSMRNVQSGYSSADSDVADSDTRPDDKMQSHKFFRDSASTAQSFMLYTPDEERAVIRKFDYKLVLFVAFLYMLSFLDRSSMSPFFTTLEYISTFPRQLERQSPISNRQSFRRVAHFPLVSDNAGIEVDKPYLVRLFYLFTCI